MSWVTENRRLGLLVLVVVVSLVVFAAGAATGSVFVNESDLRQFVPKGYGIVKWAEGDLNADGQKDVAVAVQANSIRYGLEDRLAKIIVLFRNGKNLKKAWSYSDRYSYLIGEGEGPAVNNHTIEIADFNGDGVKELAFRMTNMGASDATVSVEMYVWAAGKFARLVSLCHSLGGGFEYEDGSTFAPRKAVLAYDIIWDDGESHADAHRYQAQYYRWDPAQRKYRRYEKAETKAKGQQGLQALHSITRELWGPAKSSSAERP